jgi:hypothetical protein
VTGAIWGGDCNKKEIEKFTYGWKRSPFSFLSKDVFVGLFS